MGLNPRVHDGLELLQDFELAGGERLRDAANLLRCGNSTGAAYLAGYAAEMAIKQAVFRFDGADANAGVKPRLNPIKKWAKMALPSYSFVDFHDVLFWAYVLRKKRIDRGRTLSEPTAQNLVRLARRLKSSWSVQLRYYHKEVSATEAKAVIEDATWIHKNRAALWS